MHYAELLRYYRRGLRNGNWTHLSSREKSLYRAVLCYTKVQTRIVNARLRALVIRIMEKLRETPGLRILKAGKEAARQLIRALSQTASSPWSSRLIEWLEDRDYVFWLGMSVLGGRVRNHKSCVIEQGT